MPLTLLVPDLLPPDGAPEAMRAVRLPALERALARADAVREPGGHPDWLLARFGAPPAVSLAGLTARADGLGEGDWLRADPVHQRVERDALVLHDAAVLSLSADESGEAIAALNGFFGADGLAFEAPHPHRWYVRVPPGERPATVPLHEAVGGNPFGRLPSGGARLRWRSLFSEAQMLLAKLPLNEAREARGAPALNGLWFWGEGEAPVGLSGPFARLLADDPLASGLAQAAGLRCDPPGTLAALEAAEGRDTLVVIDDLTREVRRADASAWAEAARRLERDWFDGLLAAVPRFGSIRVALPGPSDTRVFHLTARARWRFLRRPRPLAAHA